MMDNNDPLYETRLVTTYDAGNWGRREAGLVREVPLVLVLNGRPVVTMACSPQAMPELALGYLLSEGILARGVTVKAVDCRRAEDCGPAARGGENGAETAPASYIVRVETDGDQLAAVDSGVKAVNTCNGQGFDSLQVSRERFPAAPGGQAFYARDLLALSRLLDETSGTFKITGGVHSAALGHGGELLCRYEDIGRHNAVDKTLGYAFTRGWDMSDKILVLSGRIASEILVKAYRHGLPMVLSRSAPTLKAVALAERLNMTVAGFTRGERFNLYTGAERIIA